MAKDYLWLQLNSMPYFRGLLRAVEARFYKDIDLPSPTLDIGCGDGHFASVAFDRKIEVGLDPWAEPLKEAEGRGVYQMTVLSSGADAPFEDGHFASAVSNSVLEHIPDVEAVLKEAARLLRPGGIFAFCVPNHNFDPKLSIALFFDRIGFHASARAYRKFFDKIARHQHLDSPEVWSKRLDDAGFEVVNWWHYFSPKALAVLEWGHYFGLPSLITRKLTGRWILSPTNWNLALTRRIVEPYFNESTNQAEGVCTFYIARRRG